MFLIHVYNTIKTAEREGALNLKTTKEKLYLEPQKKISKEANNETRFSLKSDEVCCTVAPGPIKW